MVHQQEDPVWVKIRVRERPDVPLGRATGITHQVPWVTLVACTVLYIFFVCGKCVFAHCSRSRVDFLNCTTSLTSSLSFRGRLAAASMMLNALRSHIL